MHSQREVLLGLLSFTLINAAQASKAVEGLWLSLAFHPINVVAILHLLLRTMVARQGEEGFEGELMPLYKRVALYCCRAHTRVTVWRLVQAIYEGDRSDGEGDGVGLRGRLAVQSLRSVAAGGGGV